MLMVTESAGAHLAKVLVNANAAEEKVVRFVSEEDRLVPKLDTKRPGDMTFDHEGKTVLVLETDIAATLTNRTLDVTDTNAGPRLYLRED